MRTALLSRQFWWRVCARDSEPLKIGMFPGHQSRLSDYVKLLRTNYEHGDEIKYISMKHIAWRFVFYFPFIALEESRSQKCKLLSSPNCGKIGDFHGNFLTPQYVFACHFLTDWARELRLISNWRKIKVELKSFIIFSLTCELAETREDTGLQLMT